jgi:hypothetical protein
VARIVFEGEALDGPAGQAAAASRFTAAKGQVLDILAPQGTDAARLVLVGAGKKDAFDALGAENAAASGYNAVKASGLETLRVELPPSLDPIPRRIDWQTTWTLVSAFVEAESVEVIFLDYGSQRRLYKAAQALGIDEQTLAETLQYPRGSKANLGRVRHSPGHEGHIHVRFACGPAEPECA